MKANRILALVALVVATVTFDVARATEHPKKKEHPTKTEHPAKTAISASANSIFAVASGSGHFKTFIAAIEAAGSNREALQRVVRRGLLRRTAGD